MKQKIKFIAFLISLISFYSCEHRAINTVIPKDWMGGVEGGPSISSKLEQSVDQTFNLHAQILDKTIESNSGWNLGEMIFDLGISVEGALGVLIGEGEVAVRSAWIRNNNLVSNIKPSSPQIMSIQMKADENENDLENKLDFMQEMAMSTGQIKNPEVLRRNMKVKLLQFRKMGQLLDMNELEEEGWHLSEYRQALSITAEGDVGSISLGGLISFQMNWIIRQENNQDGMTLQWGNRNRSLNTLLAGLAADLKSVATKTHDIEESGFEFEKLYVEIGLKGEEEFGVVSGEVETVGKLVFSRNNDNVESRSIPLLKNNYQESTMPLLGTNPTTISLFSTGENIQAMKVDRSVFRRGLTRALKMGCFFAKRAARVKSHNWIIKEIESEFEIAMNGTVGVATIEGFAALSLEFERKENGNAKE